MKTSPLQLEKLFFTKVFIHAHPEGSPKAKWDVEASPQIAPRGEEGKWAVGLRVTIKQVGDQKPQYHGEVELAGSFSVDEKWPKERTEQLIYVNGSSVLYAAAREMISNITGRGPWPMLCLPTLSFVDSAPKPTRRKESETSEVKGE